MRRPERILADRENSRFFCVKALATLERWRAKPIKRGSKNDRSRSAGYTAVEPLLQLQLVRIAKGKPILYKALTQIVQSHNSTTTLNERPIAGLWWPTFALNSIHRHAKRGLSNRLIMVDKSLSGLSGLTLGNRNGVKIGGLSYASGSEWAKHLAMI